MADTVDFDSRPVFDPASELFIAQFARPGDLQSINMRALSPFHRALLVIDGTVTKFLEAYTLEPIDTIRLGQAARAGADDLGAAAEWLSLDPEADILARHVMIQGRYSKLLYAYAVSLIATDRIPAEIAEGLDRKGGSLGAILNSSKVESRREILWYGKERTRDLPEEVRELTDGEFIVRTYRILMGGKPIMLISEKFPAHDDRNPWHD